MVIYNIFLIFLFECSQLYGSISVMTEWNIIFSPLCLQMDMTAALWWVNHIELWGLVLTKWLVCVMSQSFLALESMRLIATTMKPAVRHAIAWVARTRRMHARRGFIHEYNVRKPDLFTRPHYSGNRTLNLHSELDTFQLYDWWDVIMLRRRDVIIVDSLGMWKRGWIALR